MKGPASGEGNSVAVLPEGVCQCGHCRGGHEEVEVVVDTQRGGGVNFRHDLALDDDHGNPLEARDFCQLVELPRRQQLPGRRAITRLAHRVLQWRG